MLLLLSLSLLLLKWNAINSFAHRFMASDNTYDKPPRHYLCVRDNLQSYWIVPKTYTTPTQTPLTMSDWENQPRNLHWHLSDNHCWAWTALTALHKSVCSLVIYVDVFPPQHVHPFNPGQHFVRNPRWQTSWNHRGGFNPPLCCIGW